MVRGHLLERLETGHGTDTTVDPQAIDARRRQRPARRDRRRAVHGHEVLAERHRRQDRQVAQCTRFLDGQQQVREVARCLQDEQVDAAFQEPFDLLPDGGADGDRVGSVRAVDGRTKGSHGACHEHVPTRHIPRLARQLGCPAIDARGPVGQTVGFQAEPVGAEGVGLDDVRARRDVLPVDGADDVRMRLDQLVERRSLGDAPAEQQGAHGAVQEQRTSRQPLDERASRARQGGRARWPSAGTLPGVLSPALEVTREGYTPRRARPLGIIT